MYIGVIAGNHQQFLDWLSEETRFPAALARNNHNTFVTPSLTISYIASPEAARGREFNMIILTGRYADSWSDDEIDALYLRLK